MAVVPGACLLLTSTVKINESLWPYDVKRLLELALLTLLFLVVLLNSTLRAGFGQQIKRLPAWIGAAISVFFFLGVLSSIDNARSAASASYSLADVALYGLLVLGVFSIAACRKIAGRNFDQAVILLLSLLAVAVGLQELLGVIAAWNSGVEFNPEIALLHFSYPRFYNQVQTWSIPVITALPLIFPGKPLNRILCVAALGLEWYVMLATGGRGSIASVTTAILLAILILPGIRSTLAVYSAAGLVTGVMIYGLVLMGHHHLRLAPPAVSVQSHKAVTAAGQKPAEMEKRHIIRDGGDEARRFSEPLTGSRLWTFSGRIPLWRDSLRDAVSHPLLGTGPMNYACTGPLNRSAHPHNFLLQIAGEWGIPALLILLAALARGWIGLWRYLSAGGEANGVETLLAGFLATSLLAASLHACLSGVLVMPASQIAGLLVCGWLLGLLPGPSPDRRKQMSTVVLLASGLAMGITLLAFARQELAVAELHWQQTAILDRGIPRLWQNGKVCGLYMEHGDAGTKTAKS